MPTIVHMFLVLIVVGVTLWLINQAPMVAWMKQLINVIAIILVALYLLNFFGVVSGPVRFAR